MAALRSTTAPSKSRRRQSRSRRRSPSRSCYPSKPRSAPNSSAPPTKTPQKTQLPAPAPQDGSGNRRARSVALEVDRILSAAKDGHRDNAIADLSALRERYPEHAGAARALGMRCSSTSGASTTPSPPSKTQSPVTRSPSTSTSIWGGFTSPPTTSTPPARLCDVRSFWSQASPSPVTS